MECIVRNIKVYYEVHGEGTPILMIHGHSPDHRLMKGCMEPVFKDIETKWKRIYFDLPGMGRTKGEPWITGSDQMLDFVLNFIDAVIPNHKFVLAGESYGGYLARGIIKKHSELTDGLLLICPAIRQEMSIENAAEFQVLEKDELLLNSLSEEDRKFFTGKGINVSQNKRVWDRFKEEVLPGLKIAEYSFLTNSLGKNISFSFDPDALEKPYLKPALMLAGRQDSVVGYRDLMQIIGMYPRTTLAILDRAGHDLQIEQDVIFTEMVKEWLFRVSNEINQTETEKQNA
ncbi:MAG: alpha/beta hydrolase [Spirochaetes bacterium]|nr:alpha/beta hydrolase [Spirochaetota bacterium]